MNYKPTIANIEKFMNCRMVEIIKRGYKFGKVFVLDKFIYFAIQRDVWEQTQYLFNVKRRDRASVISILNQVLKVKYTEDAESEIHEIKYLIEVLSHDWMFNREMNTYEEEAKND